MKFVAHPLGRVTRAAAADHEAAHAVIGEELGIRTIWTSIYRDPDRGPGNWLGCTRQHYCEVKIDFALMVIAGSAAENMWHAMPMFDMSRGDSRELARVWRARNLAHEYRSLYIAAWALVHACAPSIKRVSRALVRDGRLSGTRVRRLLDR